MAPEDIPTRTLIIAATAAAAQGHGPALAALDPLGLPPLDVGLVPAGGNARRPTHYWCSWRVTETKAAAIMTLADPDVGPRRNRGFVVYDAADWTPDDVLADLHLERMGP